MPTAVKKTAAKATVKDAATRKPPTKAPRKPTAKKTKKPAKPAAAAASAAPPAARPGGGGEPPVVHGVGRLEYWDPRKLVVDPFNHRKKRLPAAEDAAAEDVDAGDSTEPDPDLCASVAEFGVQIPVLIRPQGDGSTYGVIWGQRRRRAAELAADKAEAAGQPYRPIPCLVRDDLAGADDRAVFLSMIENKQRAEADARDDLDALEQLALLNISDAERGRYARALGYKPAEIKHANRAGRLSDAELRRAITELDLVEAADYAEVADVAEALGTLREAKMEDGEDPQGGRGAWAHAMAELRQTQADNARLAEVRAELEREGVALVRFPWNGNWGWTASRPLEELHSRSGTPLDPEQHKKSCPSHAAAIDPDTITPVYVCQQWKAHGHTLPGDDSARADAEAKARARDERRRVIAGNKAWRTARPVRQEFITDLCARKEISDPMRVFVLSTITGTGHDYSRFVGGNKTELTAQFLGVPDPNANSGYGPRAADPFGAVIKRTGKARWWRPLLAQVAACMETERMHDGAWRYPDRAAASWLRLLEAEGYRLATIETDTATEPTPDTTPDEGAAGADSGDDDQGEGGGEPEGDPEPGARE